MKIWKRKIGLSGTYRELVNVFERAGYRDYAETVKKSAHSSDNDSSDIDEPIPQPQTYPDLKTSCGPSSHKPSTSGLLSYEEFSLIDPAAAEGLPKRKNCY